MQLLDGKLVSSQILKDLKSKISNLSSEPHLHVILVGNDPASVKYVSLKEKQSQQIGVKFTLYRLPSTTDETGLIKLINDLNNNPKVTGFFIQLPLPPISTKPKFYH